VESTDGSSRLVQKKTIECESLGPVTSGFNEAACNVFQGTWCPMPRDCSSLVKCIDKAIGKASRTGKIVFYEYLNGAPKLKVTEVRLRCIL
jgi:hypothetical protein